MIKKYFSIRFSVVFGAAIIAAAFAANSATAQSENGANGIQYPIKELGGCADSGSCKTFCDNPSNTEACLSFAEKNGMMSEKEIQTARNFANSGPGPGGCKSKDECETYCDSVSHIDECVAFAEKNGLMPPEQLAEAKKIQAAKARGVKMPACGSKKQCDTYCSESAHMEECITFGQEAGLIPPNELEDSKKVLAAVKAGVNPPACKGKKECDAYCSQEEHFNSCLDFAAAAGLMDSKDLEMARKTKGKGPGNCRGKEECGAFCKQDANMEICAQFALDNGMMTKDEYEMMKKTGGKGPGGCTGKEECDNFCDNPDNQQTCFDFGKEHGLISADDLKRTEDGNKQFKESFQNMPPEVYSCLEEAFGADKMEKFKNGRLLPSRDTGDKMRACFEKMDNRQNQNSSNQQNEPNRQNNNSGDSNYGGAPRSGPGGCLSPEECDKYCQSNKEECAKFHEQNQNGRQDNRQDGPKNDRQNEPRNEPARGTAPIYCDGENCPPPPPLPPQPSSSLDIQNLLGAAINAFRWPAIEK